MSFKPSPGDNLEIGIMARNADSLPAGDLIVEPYWGGYEKDRIVGAMIDSDVRPYVLGAGAIGVILLIASSILAISSARRPQRT
ncbi:MAG: hypothetical protein ACRD15_20015 [Vicinamibacterales bacterium]